jgi:hypothetical protein
MTDDVLLNVPMENPSTGQWVRVVAVPFPGEGGPAEATIYQVELSESADGPWTPQLTPADKAGAFELARELATRTWR